MLDDRDDDGYGSIGYNVQKPAVGSVARVFPPVSGFR
jgi:hypothetical protein